VDSVFCLGIEVNMGDLPDLDALNEKLKEADEIVKAMDADHDFSSVFLAVQDTLVRNMQLIEEIKTLESTSDTGKLMDAAEKITELNRNLDEVVRMYSEYSAPQDGAPSP